MIRKISINDKEKYIAMAKEFYKSDAVLHNIPDENIYKTFDTIVSGSPFADAYIYEHNGDIAGYALLSLTYSNEAGGHVLWIEEVYILTEYQGHGFGKELFAFIEKAYKDKVVRIRLEVEEANHRAISLYERLGYTRLDYMQMYKRV